MRRAGAYIYLGYRHSQEEPSGSAKLSQAVRNVYTPLPVYTPIPIHLHTGGQEYTHTPSHTVREYTHSMYRWERLGRVGVI